MTDNAETTERMDRLEQQVRAVSTAFLLFVGVLFVFALLLDVGAQLQIPSLSRLFDEMLPGEPLPLLTLVVIEWRVRSLVLDLVLLAAVAAAAVSKKLVLLVPIGTVAALLLLGKALLTTFALKLPLLRLLDKLGGF